MAGLEAEERDRPGSPDNRAVAGSGRAVEPRGHIDGEHRATRASRPEIEPLDRPRRDAVERARKTGAEQGVDNEIGLIEAEAVERGDGAGPSRGGPGGVAAQGLTRAEQRQRHLTATLDQKPGGDEAIAAVIAGPAENGDARGARPFPAHEFQRRVRDRLARRLHQHGARRSSGNSQPVGFRHFGGGEKLGMRDDHARKEGTALGGTQCPR